MVQKMELLTQDLASMSDPTDAELQAFLDDNVENYRVPPRMRFTHVYFNPDRRGNSVESDARQALEQIRSRRPVPQQVDDLGDRFLPGQNSRLRTPDEVARDYGTPFAEALFDLSAGWHGPLVSGYGLHLVHVIERVESRVPTLDQVRRRLVTDLQRTRREEAMEGLYQALLEGYRIEIDEVAIEDQAIAVP